LVHLKEMTVESGRFIYRKWYKTSTCEKLPCDSNPSLFLRRSGERLKNDQQLPSLWCGQGLGFRVEISRFRLEGAGSRLWVSAEGTSPGPEGTPEHLLNLGLLASDGSRRGFRNTFRIKGSGRRGVLEHSRQTLLDSGLLATKEGLVTFRVAGLT